MGKKMRRRDLSVLREFFCIFGRAVKLMDARCNFFSPSNFISLQCLIGMDVKTMGILRYL